MIKTIYKQLVFSTFFSNLLTPATTTIMAFEVMIGHNLRMDCASSSVIRFRHCFFWFADTQNSVKHSRAACLLGQMVLNPQAADRYLAAKLQNVYW